MQKMEENDEFVEQPAPSRIAGAMWGTALSLLIFTLIGLGVFYGIDEEIAGTVVLIVTALSLFFVVYRFGIFSSAIGAMLLCFGLGVASVFVLAG